MITELKVIDLVDKEIEFAISENDSAPRIFKRTFSAFYWLQNTLNTEFPLHNVFYFIECNNLAMNLASLKRSIKQLSHSKLIQSETVRKFCEEPFLFEPVQETEASFFKRMSRTQERQVRANCVAEIDERFAEVRQRLVDMEPLENLEDLLVDSLKLESAIGKSMSCLGEDYTLLSDKLGFEVMAPTIQPETVLMFMVFYHSNQVERMRNLCDTRLCMIADLAKNRSDLRKHVANLASIEKKNNVIATIDAKAAVNLTEKIGAELEKDIELKSQIVMEEFDSYVKFREQDFFETLQQYKVMNMEAAKANYNQAKQILNQIKTQ